MEKTKISPQRIRELRILANELRQRLLPMLHEGGSGHPGGSLSAADLLVALYHQVMRIDPRNPGWPERDRFILSKGQTCPALYIVLAQRGYFSPEILSSFRKIGSPLQGSFTLKTCGTDFATGSLGQGLSAGVGMALAGRHRDLNFRVYVMVGDGESEEGQIWEAAMTAAHYKLDNLVCILDYNKIQGDDFVANTMALEPLAAKWRAFGWHVIEINGHDMEQILNGFAEAGAVKGKPSILVAHTIKGKGVSFMENQPKWHGSGVPNDGEVEKALCELRKERESL